jgi:alkylhydroperoxidase family enzyme
MHRQKALSLACPPKIVEALTNGGRPNDLSALDAALLDWTQVITTTPSKTAIQIARDTAAKHLSHEQLGFISYVVAQINAWNRLAMANTILFNQPPKSTSQNSHH